MTTLLEAAKQALEALEAMLENGRDFTATRDNARVAITAGRQAIANEALNKMAENEQELGIQMQAEQTQPVAWFHTATNQAFTSEPPPSLKAQCKVLVFADAAPPPRQPLTDEVKNAFWIQAIEHGKNGQSMNWQKAADFYADAIEAAHGIMSVPDGKGEA